MDIAGENLAYKSDNELVSYNSGLPMNMTETAVKGLGNHFKKRMSDQDLILTDTDDNVGYMEGEESGLYIQINNSQVIFYFVNCYVISFLFSYIFIKLCSFAIGMALN